MSTALAKIVMMMMTRTFKMNSHQLVASKGKLKVRNFLTQRRRECTSTSKVKLKVSYFLTCF